MILVFPAQMGARFRGRTGQQPGSEPGSGQSWQKPAIFASMTYRQNMIVAVVAGLLSVVGLTLAVMAGAAPSPATPPQPTPYPSHWSLR